jgi:metallophosphoesterase superfamily enzyme
MILAGDRPRAFAPCAGLLVIGDLHVSSRRPGRRTDASWPEPILRKLERCAAIANERDLLPVLLGDLFERPVEPDMALLSRLVRILKSFRHRPLANVGNHDIGHTRLSDGDSLAVLALSDVLDVVAVSGPVGVVAASGASWGLSRCAQAGQRMRAVIPSFDLT